MRLIQVTGFKKSGKTTLIKELIGRLAEKGLKSGVIKHVNHGANVRGDNDSALFLESGSEKVIIDGGHYIFEQRINNGLPGMIKKFKGFDFLFIEGKKDLLIPRIICLKGDPGENELDINTIAKVSMIKGSQGRFVFEDGQVGDVLKKSPG